MNMNASRLSYILTALIIFVTLFTVFEIQILDLRDKNQQLESLLSRTQQALQERDISSDDDNLVVIYNRVPKTGSTSFVGVAYDLCKKNKFHVLHINITSNMHVLSLPNQYKFVHNISTWQEMKPALYHGHMAFLDFSRLSTNALSSINRIVSPVICGCKSRFFAAMLLNVGALETAGL